MVMISVSIHAPGRGATSEVDREATTLGFQFTHPGGVRPCLSSSAALAGSFQFTHPGGVRLRAFPAPAHVEEFQFTHPGGVRPLLAVAES